MNVFFASGEDSGFANGLITNISTGSGFVSGFARAAFFPQYSGNISTPSLAISGATVWCHFMVQFFSALWSTGTGALFTFTDTAGHSVIVAATSTAGQVNIQKFNGTSTYSTLYTSLPGAFVGNPATPQPIDIFLNYSSSGELSIYQNGNLIVDTGTGVNMVYSGSTTIEKFTWQNIGSNFVSYFTYGISEVIVADPSTLGMRLATVAPAAAGNTQSWTPSTLANINKTTINDSTFISTASAAVLSEWTTASLSISGSYSVIALVEEARVEVGTSGPQHISWVTRVSGTDYTQGTVSINTSFNNYNGGPNGGVWYTNPYSGASWAISDFNATGFNIGIESQT